MFLNNDNLVIKVCQTDEALLKLKPKINVIPVIKHHTMIALRNIEAKAPRIPNLGSRLL
jgi:hypothetical protein